MSSSQRVKDIAVDLYRDGYKLVGAVAPVVSIGFTLAKALDLSVSLRNVSYAWGLLPIALWVTVAYVRRWTIHHNGGAVGPGDKDKWLWDAVYYLVHGKWPKPADLFFRESPALETAVEYYRAFAASPNYSKIGEALHILRQAVRDGEINVWARLNARRVLNVMHEPDESVLFEDVDRLHWRTHRVNPDHMLYRRDQICTYEEPGGALGKDSICSPMVCKRQIEALAARLKGLPR